MKRITKTIAVLTVCLLLVSCSAAKVYSLDEYLPPLMDITTQLPYTESISVTETASGKTIEFTTGEELDQIRMKLEGIECSRHKITDESDPIYKITFSTTDGDVAVDVISEKAFNIGEYRFSSLALDIDLFYFEKLFEN